MAEVAEAHYLDGRLSAGAARRHRGDASRLRPAARGDRRWWRPAIRCRTRPGSMPRRARWRWPTGATQDDLVLVLMSGGASANWIAPAQGLSLAEKQALTRALLRSGANDRRDQHGAQASFAHQGRPARARARIRRALVTLGDFRRAGRRSGGDRLGADSTRPDDACGRARRGRRYGSMLPPAVAWRRSTIRPTKCPKPGDPAFAGTRVSSRGAPGRRVRAAAGGVRAAGYECVFLGDRLEGEAREVAAEQARLARGSAGARPPRGDPVRRRTDGDDPRQRPRRPEPGIRTGARHRSTGSAGIAALAADTDGTDGGGGLADDPAGAYVDGRQRQRAPARSASIRPGFLADNNSTAFFAAIGDLLAPGPTYTNVNDFRAIVVDDVDTPEKSRQNSSLGRFRVPARTSDDRAPIELPPFPRPHARRPLPPELVLGSPLLGASAARAAADFRLCNNTGGRVGIALGYKDGEAGSPKAGGISARAPARRCCAANSSRDFITSMPSTMTAAANGRARRSCARARRSSRSAAPRTASRAASTAPAFSKSIPASSASWTVQLTETGRPGSVDAAADRSFVPAADRNAAAPARSRSTRKQQTMRRQRRTKIVATLGPASSDRAMIARLFEAGADVFRINMSHTLARTHARTGRP